MDGDSPDKDLEMIEHDDMVEVWKRGAVSSGEPSLDGSLDEERAALSDSDLRAVTLTQTIAKQAKGPSSDALEVQCAAEHEHRRGQDETSTPDAWEDVIGSGALARKQLKPGVGETRPRNGQRVTVRIVDQQQLGDSHSRLSFILGFSQVIEAWELVVQLMHVGEVDLVKTDPRFAYGALGVDGQIAANQTMIYSIELLAIDDVPPFSTMAIDELKTLIGELKDRGNFYYNRMEFDKAIFVYKRAVALVDTPSDQSLRDLFSMLHSNCAVCYAKLCEWKSTLEECEKSLAFNANNTKALLRRANALAMLNEIDEAIATLHKALAIDPLDPTVDRELTRLIAMQRMQREQERALYRRMLRTSDTATRGRFTALWHALHWKPVAGAVLILFAALLLNHYFQSK